MPDNDFQADEQDDVQGHRVVDRVMAQDEQEDVEGHLVRDKALAHDESDQDSDGAPGILRSY